MHVVLILNIRLGNTGYDFTLYSKTLEKENNVFFFILIKHIWYYSNCVQSTAEVARHFNSGEMYKYHNTSRSVQQMVFGIVTAVTILKTICGIEWDVWW